MHADRHSDAYKKGRRDGEQAYSDFDYKRDKYDRHGTERQRNYYAGWEESREEKHYEERRREEQEEQERQEQRAAERRQQEREQEIYEQQRMYEEQMYEEQMRQQNESEVENE